MFLSTVHSGSWNSSLRQFEALPSLLDERVASMEAEVRVYANKYCRVYFNQSLFPGQLSQLHCELSRRVQMCSNYESQLQRVQEQMVADMDEKERSMDRIRADCEKYKVK